MIDGLIYIQNYLPLEEEESLLNCIESNLWDSSLKRRTRHYGYRYDYTKRSLDKSKYLGELPKQINNIAFDLYQKKYFKKIPNQAIINEYKIGQNINAHIDKLEFGPEIASLSLCADCEMIFANQNIKYKYELHRGSLVIFTGPARYQFTHEIPKVKEKRISITFGMVL